MELFIKAAAAALLTALIGLILKKNVPELSFALSLCAAAVTAMLALRLWQELDAVLQQCIRWTGMDEILIGSVLKCLGVSILSRLCADLCMDAGQRAAADATELCGAAAALICALPLLEEFLKMMDELL